MRDDGFSILCKLTDVNLIGPHEEILPCTSDYLNVVDEEGKARESVVTTHGHTVTDLARLQTQGVQLQSWWSKPSLLCLRLNQKKTLPVCGTTSQTGSMLLSVLTHPSRKISDLRMEWKDLAQHILEIPLIEK